MTRLSVAEREAIVVEAAHTYLLQRRDTWGLYVGARSDAYPLVAADVVEVLTALIEHHLPERAS